MRLLLILFLLIPYISFAEVTYTVTVTDEEAKVLEWQLVDPQQWVINAVMGKINKSEARMLLELTDKRPDKLTKEEKKELIKNSKLKTRVERDAEAE